MVNKMEDYSNKFGVGMAGSGMVSIVGMNGWLTTQDALLLAAWLVAIAEPFAGGRTFAPPGVLEEVQSS